MSKRDHVIVVFEVETDTSAEAQSEVESLCETLTEDALEPSVEFAGVLKVCDGNAD